MLSLIPRTTTLVASLTAFSVWATSAQAWWDEGHMQIAAVAYSKLSPAAKARVNELVRLNPDYAKWIAGKPAARADEIAFVHASVWADDIKMFGSGYTSSQDEPNGPKAGQNVGYDDKLAHRYWHFKDLPFSTDGTKTQPGDPFNIVTQIGTFTTALPAASGLSDEIRSYDLIWLIHLVGDIHQPLHATSRFSNEFPDGDRGGNEQNVIPASGEELRLHFYFDRMFGGYSSPEGAIFDANDKGGIAKILPDNEMARIDDPQKWLEESFELAKRFAYAEPVLSGPAPYTLTREYETNARNVSRSQAALGAARLAHLLNAAFE